MKSNWEALGSFLSRPLLLVPTEKRECAHAQWKVISHEEIRL